MHEVYYKNLNDNYISVSTGSENKNYRNTNVENIYKAEDKLYEFDMQIDSIDKSLRVLNQQIDRFDSMAEEDQANFKLSIQIFSPMRYLWDKK